MQRCRRRRWRCQRMLVGRSAMPKRRKRCGWKSFSSVFLLDAFMSWIQNFLYVIFFSQHFSLFPTPQAANTRKEKKNELLYKFVGINVDKILSILFTYPIFVKIHSSNTLTPRRRRRQHKSHIYWIVNFAERSFGLYSVQWDTTVTRTSQQQQQKSLTENVVDSP